MIYSFSNSFRKAGASLQLYVLNFSCEINSANKELWKIIDAVCSKKREDIRLDEVNKISQIADTREGYKRCGKDPNRYRPSADSLIRRIVKGNALYKVNNVVDILNLISIQSGISIGGYNTDKIDGDILVDIGKAEDEYTGIGRGKLNIEGLPVLRDNQGVFGCPTSDSERTMISNTTKHVSFVFFNFTNETRLTEIIKETQHLLKSYAKGKDFNLIIVNQ